MKRFISYVVGIILAFGVVTLCGCTPIKCNIPERPEPYEYGDFIYEHWYENQEEFKEYEHISIIGLTEQGQTKKELLIPEEINGVPVKNLGYTWGLYWSYSYIGDIFGEEEKVYLTKSYGTHNKFFKDYYMIFITDLEIYENMSSYLSGLQIKMPERESKKLSEASKYLNDVRYFANVVYYKNDGSDKISFVDDYDGGKITFMPPEPKREGYEFAGWYREEECINEWNFAVDEVPEKEYGEDGEYNFKETSLFAKWVKI